MTTPRAITALLALAWLIGGITGLEIGGPWQATAALLPAIAIITYTAKDQTRPRRSTGPQP